MTDDGLPRESTTSHTTPIVDEPSADFAAEPLGRRRSSELPAVGLFLVALSVLLAGYMFLGRGFAHLGVPPIFLSEVVLGLGVVASVIAMVQLRLRIARSWLVGLLILFMILGAARTVPYLGTYGVDALRDAVLWGYGAFALIVYLLADRSVLLKGARLYGVVAAAFAFWLPIAWHVFGYLQDRIPLAPGSDVPLLFFKSQDMAVHAIGAIAFLVVGTSALATRATFLWRFLVAVSLTWAVWVTGSISRGALAAVVAGAAVLVVLAPRSRNWAPVLLAALVLVLALVTAGGPLGPSGPQPDASPGPSIAPSGQPTPGNPSSPAPAPSTPSPQPTAEPTPSPTGLRAASPGQWIENILSVILPSEDENLEGTKRFRLAWWSKIIDYTVTGPYFWTGKGFGVNLADDDGFQVTADHSLRAPHNSHLTALARMGVPGFVLWVLLQGAFGIQMLRSVRAHRRIGDAKVAAIGVWILVYWTAMMVNTSFDPYLEGPQGGIWFWTLFGLGLVVIRLTPRNRGT